MRKSVHIFAPAIAAIIVAWSTTSCQPTILSDPTTRDQLLEQISEIAPPDIPEKIRNAPFMLTPKQGADLAALKSILNTIRKQEPIPIPWHQIDDDATWRLAPHHEFQSKLGETYAARLLNPYQWHLDVRETAGIRVGVLHANGIKPDVPWDTIGRAIETNRLMTKTDLPAEDGGALVIVYGGPLSPLAQASSHDTHINIRSGYGKDSETAAWILAHEITHRWWVGNARYIDEGIAELVAAIATAGPRPPNASVPCNRTTVNQKVNRQTELCDYQLGGLLMNKLFTASGPEKFQSAISQLYLLSGEGEVITLQHLKQSFPDRRSQFAIEQTE